MGKLIGFLVGIVILVLVILFLLGKGVGFGGGTGTNLSESATDITAQTDSDSASSSVSSPAIDFQDILKVSVTENNYIYENKSVTLDEIITAAETAENPPVVEITDDNASLQAYEKLIQQLVEHNIKYIEPTT
ncbi:hypothetical protein [Gemmiger sp.]